MTSGQADEEVHVHQGDPQINSEMSMPYISAVILGAK